MISLTLRSSQQSLWSSIVKFLPHFMASLKTAQARGRTRDLLSRAAPWTIRQLRPLPHFMAYNYKHLLLSEVWNGVKWGWFSENGGSLLVNLIAHRCTEMILSSYRKQYVLIWGLTLFIQAPHLVWCQPAVGPALDARGLLRPDQQHAQPVVKVIKLFRQ